MNFDVTESIEMLYPTEAVNKFGEKGKKGVFIFKGITIFKKNIPAIQNVQLNNKQSKRAQYRSIDTLSNVASNFNNFNILITKNTTEAELELIKTLLKEKFSTNFTSNVSRNNTTEIIALSIK
jgi:hypothetical protein